MATGRIVIRADSGLDIGTGHVMRCLTLADALRDQGAEVVFVTRRHKGHVIPALTGRGHRVVILPGNTGVSYGAHRAPPAHAGWLGAAWSEDAAATRRVLDAEGADWLVMDHYALDREWQQAALTAGTRLLVVDDLADRPHMADILLDQNAGRQAADYNGLVPDDCDRLIGPTHALLRAEFAQSRSEALARRDSLSRPERLLVTLGGIDKTNVAATVLEALAASPVAAGFEITVIMGGSAPWLEEVQSRAACMPMPTEVAIDVANMAQHMTRADLCIGAAGSTAWERCTLGLPTLQVVLADNQMAAASYMDKHGLALALPFPDAPDFASAVSKGLEHLSQRDTYRTMAHRAAALTDGEGTGRLAHQLIDREPLHAH
ncbi:UDP-2,4-diacetamido-2,4,6-trideoxy-beta-L-altropyranose hydrolase [Pseudophaeobacter arcticus]|uniref:UDP-2,4-diacetamido-2,4, 6-trideoxy-beta-L-altropyranose hydrolase n=1 Tax=Pseudophaeobacter arcticus TaxID=385492 RepID=UPI003A96B77F